MLVIALSAPQQAYADVPYDSYYYDFWSEDVLQPHAYLYKFSIGGKNTDLSMNYPEDMFIFDNRIYIADTGNSRILVLNSEGETEAVINSFSRGTETEYFNKPQGIFVTDAGHIYIADSGNSRIVELGPDGEFVREIGRPETNLIAADQNYIPTKVVVDKTGRVYAVCYGLNMGLVEFDRHGQFQGFMGAAKVSVNMFYYIWKNYFSTEMQKQRMETIIPTEYNNIFIDHENFIYTTIGNLSDDDYMEGADAIRRLNPTGIDVLRRLGNYPIIGDLYQVDENAEWSRFVDVCATDYGCYFILDSAGGKVFAYDYDGNSLFIFGKKGNRLGNVQKPASIGITSDQSRILILDSLLNSILVFEITEYGSHLLSAMEKHSRGDSRGAFSEWQEVLKRNANFEIAYIGIGKTLLKEGSYREAMKYFKLGNSRKYYTKAFQCYRREYMQDKFGLFMGAVLLVVLVICGAKVYKKIKDWMGKIGWNS